MRDEVALVTGGSTGIGKATALAFSARGAAVVIASRREREARLAVAEIEEKGGRCLWSRTDVTVAAEVEAMVERAVEAFGRLDYAFNNAGSGGRGGFVHEMAESDWARTVDGYLKSVFLCMKAEIPALLQSGGGSIVNTSSVDGQRGFPWDPAYSAAKHGILGLTKSAAMQYADRGLRVNAVCPGWILTDPIAEAMRANPGVEQRWLLHQPIGRLGEPREVAEAVVWLCSDGASMVTGTALAVDGGYLAV